MIKIVDASPSPKSHISMLSRIGYEFNTAIGDILDNSITAKAKNIDVVFDFDGDDAFLEIRDDGFGMSKEDLQSNMVIGCKDPLLDRASGDLGRFGAGLKTASFSQCRQLSVFSKTKASLGAGAIWDLDLVESEDRWSLQIFNLVDHSCERISKELADFESGTVVRWDSLSCISNDIGQEERQDQLSDLCYALRGYLGLHFHRFLSGKDKISVSLNGLSIVAIDPFMKGVRGSEDGPSTSFRTGKGKVYIRAFYLPHFSNMTSKEIEFYGGQGGIRDGQGLYIYREKRLIVAGGWMGLQQSNNLSDLARIQIDVPAALDNEWSTDVKKSTLQIPQKVKRNLRKLLTGPVKRSKRAYIYRGKQETANDYWEIREGDREQTISYEIDQSNSELADIMSCLEKKNALKLTRYLANLSSDLPINHIFHKMSEDPRAIDQARLSEESYVDNLYKVFEDA